MSVGCGSWSSPRATCGLASRNLASLTTPSQGRRAHSFMPSDEKGCMGRRPLLPDHLGEEKEYYPVSNAVGAIQVNPKRSEISFFPQSFFPYGRRKQSASGARGKPSISLSRDSQSFFSGLLNMSSRVGILRTSWALAHFFSSASCCLLLNAHLPISSEGNASHL